MKRALVSGHRGFVGRHLVRRLESDGYDVLGIDLVDGWDALDFFRTDRESFAVAFHCAAIVGGRLSIDGSPLSVATNAALDVYFFDWLLRSKTPRAVYFSSSAAYPTYLQASEWARPLREQDLDLSEAWTHQADASYGAVKQFGESLAPMVRAEGCALHVLRPFSGYGPGQALDYPFPSFIERAKRRADPFEVWGDGQVTRDFVHIDDVIGATMAVVDQDYQEPLNIGTGIGTTFDDLAHLCMSAAGYSGEIRHDLSKPTGPKYRVADVTRLHEVYEPRISLHQGIREALA